MANDIVFERDYREAHKLMGACTYTEEKEEAFQSALKSGVYKSIDEIKANNGIEKTITPTESDEWRESHVKTWRRAVERSLGWID